MNKQFHRDHAEKDGAAIPAAESPDFAFKTILFPPGLETMRNDRRSEPACFPDLNLDQVIDAVVAGRDEEILRPIFYSPVRNEEVVRFRQAVFGDLGRPEVLRIFPSFCDAMRTVRANLAYADRIGQTSHKHMVILRAAGLYCDGVEALTQHLQALALRSAGLTAFRDYLAGYAGSTAFRTLAAETAGMRDKLFHIRYGMLFRGDKVTVRKYASEPDYAVTIRERFARFREADATSPATPAQRDDFSLNHIEEGILEFVGHLFPEQFGSLSDFVARHHGFIDGVVARFEREIGFYIAYLEFIGPLRRAGLEFCQPDISVSSRKTVVAGSFDLALAAKLVKEKAAVIRNDFELRAPERLVVVSGPNQGGKTTFARMFGQLHILAGLGCPVPGTQARLFLPDRVFTHFEREEDISNLRGKLEDELVRLHETCEAMTSCSVIVLNEIFNSTSLEDQVFLCTEVLRRILDVGAIGVCVTFIDALSRLNDRTVSMVSTVDPDEPARRTFRVVRKPADGLAYALSLARKRGVTYDQLLARIQP